MTRSAKYREKCVHTCHCVVMCGVIHVIDISSPVEGIPDDQCEVSLHLLKASTQGLGSLVLFVPEISEWG